MEKKKECSLFEETLMWTSYRYCIGRHSYVTSMAGDIGKHYYDRLSEERRQFTAFDIRREIARCLDFDPFNFRYDGVHGSEGFTPVEDLMRFFDEQGVDSVEKLLSYRNIKCYIDNDGVKRFDFSKSEPHHSVYASSSDLDDLLPWETLASLFDVENHMIATVECEGKTSEIEVFRTYERKKALVDEGNPSTYRYVEFGWEPIWVCVDNYLSNPSCYPYLNNKYIKSLRKANDN